MTTLKYPLIGVTGRSKAGKDTVCKMAVRHLNRYRKDGTILALATPLKEICYAVYGPAYGVPRTAFFGSQAEKEQPIPAIPLWTGRKILQHVGTEGFRAISSEVWGLHLIGSAADALKGRSDRHVVFVSDVRYPDEAALIRNAGGIIVKLVRPSIDKLAETTSIGLANHASEANFDRIECDYSINNYDRSLGDLDDLVLNMLEHYTLVPSSKQGPAKPEEDPFS